MALKWMGHEAWLEIRDRREQYPDAQVKHWAVCNCGWKSTWRATENDAVGAMLNHLWRVTVAPMYPEKGRMVKRHGETMSKEEFVEAIRGPSA